jgi:hypothetical protein
MAFGGVQEFKSLLDVVFSNLHEDVHHMISEHNPRLLRYVVRVNPPEDGRQKVQTNAIIKDWVLPIIKARMKAYLRELEEKPTVEEVK